MNSYMTTNSQLKYKNKLSKQLQQEQNHRKGDHMRVIRGEGAEGEWRKRYRK